MIYLKIRISNLRDLYFNDLIRLLLKKNLTFYRIIKIYKFLKF